MTKAPPKIYKFTLKYQHDAMQIREGRYGYICPWYRGRTYHKTPYQIGDILIIQYIARVRGRFGRIPMCKIEITGWSDDPPYRNYSYKTIEDLF
ncbi:MAG: hypothetical protein QM523_00605 [Candidatus Pacebacteria bacterium]|nr:hypothetical protein [Candidatus Paceibacterota bacterium]